MYARPQRPKPNKVFPYIGISKAIRFCTGGNAYLTVDANVDWFNVDSQPPDAVQNGVPVPILDAKRNEIAGVRINDLHQPIPAGKQEEIRQALDKITFHMHYTKPNNLEREQGK